MNLSTCILLYIFKQYEAKKIGVLLHGRVHTDSRKRWYCIALIARAKTHSRGTHFRMVIEGRMAQRARDIPHTKQEDKARKRTTGTWWYWNLKGII